MSARVLKTSPARTGKSWALMSLPMILLRASSRLRTVLSLSLATFKISKVVSAVMAARMLGSAPDKVIVDSLEVVFLQITAALDLDDLERLGGRVFEAVDSALRDVDALVRAAEEDVAADDPFNPGDRDFL